MGKKKKANAINVRSGPTEGQPIPSYNLNSVRSEEDLLRPKEDGKQYSNNLTCQDTLELLFHYCDYFKHYLTTDLKHADCYHS